jgi:RHS repeat-associated protein
MVKLRDNKYYESTSFGGGRINKTNNSYDINYFITDHLGSTRAIVNANGDITAQYNYYPFGKQWKDANLVANTNRWGYNGKEKQTVYGINYLDYANRMYDPEIGRWFVQDLLQEKYYSVSPYIYCMNNPLRFIDPNGMDVYRYDDKTGDMILHQRNDDNFDQIGKFKYDKKTGEYTLKTNKKGEAKTKIDKIEKGILSDGINFKENNNVIDVGGAGQATVAGVENFLLDFSNMIDKELGGYYLSNKGSEDISHIYVGNFKNNSDQYAESRFNPNSARSGLARDADAKVHFHTHLSRFWDSDRLRPSSLGGNGSDLGFKNRELKKNPLLKFLIITNPKPFYY